MKSLRQVMGFALFFGTTSLFASPQVGDEAAYELDHSRDRTSSIIKDGAVNLAITERLPSTPKGPAYRVHYSYDLSVSFVGRKAGSGDLDVPTKYFEPQFIEELRREGEITTDEFKAKHLGQENVTTNDGSSYADADIVQFYDIKLDPASEISEFFEALLGRAALYHDLSESKDELGAGQFENIQIKAAIKHGAVPVIGAARVDVSAEYRGIPISAGFDYVPGGSNR